jgi:hypothetical protein
MSEKSDVCYHCCGKKIHSPVLMKAHLEMAHGVDITTQKFTEEMITHLDGADYFSMTYKLSCDKVTFFKYVTAKRDPDDLMAFECNESGQS